MNLELDQEKDKKQERQEEAATITCEECGKGNSQVSKGTHWICEDCKVDGEE